MRALIILFSVLMGIDAMAKTPGESEFVASKLLGEEVVLWLKTLEKKPATIGLFSVRVAQPLDPEYSTIIEADMMTAVQKDQSFKMIGCPECRTPQIEVKGERLVVKKGAPDLKAFQEFGKLYEVESFLNVDIYRTSLNVIAQVTLFETSSGQVQASERFKIPAMDWSSSAMQVLFTVGPGIGMGGKPSSKDDSDMSIGADISFLEELGFGKGGINIGTAIAGKKGYMAYIAPTLGWRGRFSASALSTLFTTGIGFGLSNDASGVAARLGYEFFIGSYTDVGISLAAMLPIKQKTNSDPLTGFIGVHLGFSLGR